MRLLNAENVDVKDKEVKWMDDLISREESLMCLTSEYLEGQEYKLDDEIRKFIKRMQNVPTVPAIPIPKGATNGDMIKALFPEAEIIINKKNMISWMYKGMIKTYPLYWWNSPYKRYETDEG